MSVYKISNKYLDKYDKFWICRNISLKLGATGILLFICNGFFKSPSPPTQYMMTALVAVLATEVLPAPTKLKQVLIFFALVTLLSFSTYLFGLFSYFKYGLLFFVIIFSFLSFKLIAKNTKEAAIPGVMILWGIMQLEGGAPTDLNAVLNSLLYFYEFALFALIIVVFYPNFKPKSFMSAFIRILEEDILNIGNKGFKNSNANILMPISLLSKKLPFCPESHKVLYEQIIHFQNNFLDNYNLDNEETIYAKSVLSELILAVNEEVLYPIDSFNLDYFKMKNQKAYNILVNLVEGYNQCKA